MRQQLDRVSVDALLDVVAEVLAERVAARLGMQPTLDPEPEPWRLLSLAEVADRLGRSERWVRDRVRVGDLARVRLDGGAFAFLLDDVIAFAEARRVGAREHV